MNRCYSKLFCWLCGLYISISPLQAEIYQWTDEKGNVHFTDKPVNNPSRVEITVEATSGGSRYASIKQLTPIYYPDPNNRTKLLVIQHPEYNIDLQNNTRKLVARLMFGNKCASPTQIRFNELPLWKSQPLGSGDQSVSSVFRTFKHFNYFVKASAANQLSRHMNKSGAMLLVPVISDFDVEACATDVSVMDAMNRFALEDKRYQFYSYPRARLYLKMHWELRSIDNSQLLYTTNTETFVDNWSGKLSYRSIRDHMFFGIEQATQNLLADESFIQFLLPDPKAVVHIAPVVDKVAGETTPVVARVEENEGGFSMLRSLDNLTGGYLQAAKMARAMAIMAGIKIRVADYYSQYGKMPDSLEVIDVSIPQHVLADNYIRAISLKLDGTIQAALTDDFGDSRLLELTPEPVESIGMIHWTCYANVDKSILDKMSCKSI